MKERPILFSAPMVRAILAGTKTQTRRVVKFKPWHQIEEREDGTLWPWMYDSERDADHWVPCPYGKPGDRLWVRETWGEPWHHAQRPYFYRASDDGSIGNHPDFDGWRPSIHMPRAASRITLEVVGVRVERLTAISEADAIAEGIERGASDGFWKLYGSGTNGDMDRSPRVAYRSLWESINGPGSWALDPWVWVVEFRRV